MRFPLPSVLYNIIWLSLLLPAPAAATRLTIPSVWQEPTSKMEFIEVPGGCFPNYWYPFGARDKQGTVVSVIKVGVATADRESENN